MPDNDSPLVLLVGHCFPDQMMLKSSVSRFLPGARFENAHSHADVERHLPETAIALVNRVLDGDFGSDDGITLIRRHASGGTGASLLLISNFPESQAEAEEAGAAPGFGKTALYDETTGDRLRAAAARFGG